VILANINPGVAGSNPTNFKILGNILYFKATNTSSGTELWKTDGTTAGTAMVTDLIAGSADGLGSILN
jgi:ELWxxDGT repeat protein